MDEESEGYGQVVKGEVSAVLSVSEYLSCRFCHSKVLSNNGIVAKCSKCSALLKVSVCCKAKSAKFVVLDESSRREVTLSAFEPILSRIVDGVSGVSMSVKLLTAPPKSYRFNERNVVFSLQEK